MQAIMENNMSLTPVFFSTGSTEARRAFALKDFIQKKMFCSVPFLLEGSPISACNTLRHRLKRDGSMCSNADLVFLLFHTGENNRSRTTT
jgi:hypothetical protein